MDIQELKRMLEATVDQWASKLPVEASVGAIPPSTQIPDSEIPPARVLPKDKRVIRTKTSGDRVYLLDEVKKTRQWITNPEVLAGLGFEPSDVVDIDDSELMKYAMAAAIYKVDEPVVPPNA